MVQMNFWDDLQFVNYVSYSPNEISEYYHFDEGKAIASYTLTIFLFNSLAKSLIFI